MTIDRLVASACAAALVASLAAPATAAAFVDVLDTPAQASPLASRSLLQSVAKAGNRLIAVGQRGHIVVSDDGGTTWKQASVPVSSDLTAVFFADAEHGWAVGHDGVVLHSDDGGERWQLQLNGRQANDLLLAAMQHRARADPGSAAAKALLAEAQRYKEQGADKPFLDVWFADTANGYIVGAYNLIFHTVDGGKNWQPWFDRTDNPKFFNLYAIRPVCGELYIAGEGGLILKLDDTARRFRALTVPYDGSFFGIAAAGTAVVAFGLRGTVYRSDDAGATWAKADAGLPATVVGATRMADGALLLADMGGRLAKTADGGRSFRTLVQKQPVPVTGLAEIGDGKLVLVGPRGAIVVESNAR
ncbi:MAG TPA: YCF48-related protein [Casimicrobiaceae bacterium]|jgi:photosystem II stability/assembly factor-like uncharacterized protein